MFRMQTGAFYLSTHQSFEFAPWYTSAFQKTNFHIFFLLTLSIVQVLSNEAAINTEALFPDDFFFFFFFKLQHIYIVTIKVI